MPRMPAESSLAAHGLPVLYALFLWWFSTGAILYLDGLPRRTYRWSLLGATAVLGLALYGLAWSRAETTTAAAYVAFTCGLGVWGWNEIAFLMGFVTGPRKQACLDDCRGWRHFGHAIETILHHELAILASAAIVVAIAWGAPNQVGTWTFLTLWAMRLSTKLNVFLGVPNLSEEFLPDHLRYLTRFFTKKPMNLLFPVSVTVATVVTAWVVQRALAPDAGPFEATGNTFLAALLALAVLEHWFLVVPLPSTALWRWGLRSRSAGGESGSGGVLVLHRRGDDPGPLLEQKAAEHGGDG
jgi:putative photosynthetic complex assembly protein 2